MTKPLVREIKIHNVVSIGQLSVVFEYFDRDEHEVMLVIVDHSRRDRRRYSAVLLKKGRQAEIAPGVAVKFDDEVTSKKIKLKIFAEGLPVTPGWLHQRRPRLCC